MTNADDFDFRERSVVVHLPYVLDEAYAAALQQIERLSQEHGLSAETSREITRYFCEVFTDQLQRNYATPREGTFACVMVRDPTHDPAVAQQNIELILSRHHFSDHNARTFLAARWVQSLRLCEVYQLESDHQRGCLFLSLE